jgi:hypothetical protein
MKLYIPERHNSVLDELDYHFVVEDNMKDADVVVLWNDVGNVERGIIRLARALGKKTVVMQHGRKGTSRYYPPFNEKIQADRLLVWGDYDKRSLIEAGQDPSRIRVVGTTVLDGLPERREHTGINIVFCPEHWDREVEENAWVKKELKKLCYKRKDIKITTKIIESHDPKNYQNPIQTNRNGEDHLDICKSLLSTADMVVGVSESTFELLAQAMGIPVVIMADWTPKPCNGDERYRTYRRIVSQASATATIKELNKTILYQLENPDDRRDMREKVVYQEGGPRNVMELIEKELACLS